MFVRSILPSHDDHGGRLLSHDPASSRSSPMLAVGPLPDFKTSESPGCPRLNTDTSRRARTLTVGHFPETRSRTVTGLTRNWTRDRRTALPRPRAGPQGGGLLPGPSTGDGPSTVRSPVTGAAAVTGGLFAGLGVGPWPELPPQVREIRSRVSRVRGLRGSEPRGLRRTRIALF
eukprot:767051-Hanusia_phi.AAC.4